MSATSGVREQKHGVINRKRTYKCRKCGKRFSYYLRNPLPEKDRICLDCERKVDRLYGLLRGTLNTFSHNWEEDCLLATIREVLDEYQRKEDE